jgi:two-component system, cell cycle sensor histidine kinase and response regulator CckA
LLKQSEQKYRLLTDHIKDAIWLMDFDLNPTYFSPSVEKLLGYTLEETKQIPLDKRLTPSSLQAAMDFFSKEMPKALAAPPDYSLNRSLELEFVCKNGRTVWGECMFSFIRDDQGKPLFILGEARNITERKQAEEKLHQSAERYRTILEDIQEGYFEVDLAGNFTFFNDALCRVSGYPMEELMGMNNRQYTDEEDLKRIYQAYHEIYTTGKPNTEFVWKIRRKDGVARYIEGSISLLKDLSGKPTGFRGIAHDITERQKTEKVLLESEKRLRGITTNMPGVVFQFYAKVNGEYGISYVSERMADIFEVPPDTELDALFPIFISHVHEEDLDQFTASVQNAVQETAPWDFEGRYIKPSGKVFWFHAMSIPTRLEDRLVFDGILLDITDRKQAEDALRESEELYTRLVDTIPDVIIRTDLQGNILFANDYTLQRSGFSWKEIEGRNILEFVPPGEHPMAVQNITRIMTDGKLGPYDYHLIIKDGSIIPFEMISGVFHSKDGKPCGYVHVCRDISLRKQTEQEKEHLQERLNQSQKMESVGRLAGGVAHDFNNMLGVILGHAELALEKTSPDQPLHAHLREIRKAAGRSADLTRQLLAFARKQTVAPRVIDLNETVAGMLKMLQRLIGEDIHLSWLPGGKSWPVKIDPSQIDQILANLCVNARDAITSVGNVSIETENIRIDEAFCVGHPDFISGDYVLLAVSDNGCGMGKEIQDKLFEPFFTTKDVGKGTGLGLATIYGIVKQNNGFLNVYSEPGRGTTFKIYLPRHIGKAEQAGTKEPPEPVSRGQETILVVEDEPAILDLSQIMLEQQGYQVLAAATPGEAIRLAEEHPGAIHLLITDVVMPEMNGRDLAKKILSCYPGIRRLFMSGYTADMIAHQGVLDEGVWFIQKPFSRKDLLAKVREVLDQQ